MDIFEYYTIPIKGLHNGVHHFEFDVDNEFFANFEDSMISNGDFKVQLTFDKKYDHSEMVFEIKGHTKTQCDRCLADIDLPIVSSNILYLKTFADEAEILADDEDVIYIHKTESKLNLSQAIYEFIILSIPAIKTYDCEADENPPCDYDVIDKIGSEEMTKKSSIWDSLKNLDLDN